MGTACGSISPPDSARSLCPDGASADSAARKSASTGLGTTWSSRAGGDYKDPEFLSGINMRKKVMRVAAVLIALELCAQPGFAEITALPNNVQLAIQAMGYSVDGKKMVSLLLPLLPHSLPPGVTLFRDKSYGVDPLQKLDIYRPKGSNLPIAVFVHGGGFTRGDKNEAGRIYGNVPAYFARHGILALNANYRLAPQVQWPAQAQDVGAIVRWLKKNATHYGGNPNHIVLVGHSAGATNVAQYVFDNFIASEFWIGSCWRSAD